MNKFSSARIWEWKQNSAPVTVKTECALLLYTEGRANVYFNRKRHALTGKHLLYVQPQASITLEPVGKGASAVYGLFFHSYRLQNKTTDTLTYCLDYTKLPNNGFILKPLPPSIPGIVRQLIRLQVESPFDEYACDRCIEELVQHISKQMNTKPLSRPSAQEAVEETMHAMLKHCERNWNRDAVAGDRRFNTSHLSRAFKQHSGYSFSAFLSKVRLNRAKILLLSSDMTLDAIAHRVGFLSGLYLSRRFKQDCGLSPSEYRQQLRREPLRVAAMTQAGNLLAVGIQPVAASLAPWNTAAVLHRELLAGGTADCFEFEDLELLSALRPDLLLIPEYTLIQNARKLQQLERVASVLFFPSFGVDPFAQLRQLAGVVGRAEAAERWIADFEASGQAWRRQMQALIPPTESVALYELRGTEQIILWQLGARGNCNLYRTLRWLPPDSIKRDVLDKETMLCLPLADLPDYCADHMFVIVGDSEDAYDRFYVNIKDHPVWSSLEAYRKKRIYRLPLSAFWADDALTLDRQLPLLADAVEAAPML
ncbi:helix-turn-helix domain-containing protein [Cohnella cellulosilytica]|uniref:Helix-turn-helix domain-containing protein n=1 Tax=Cohnella cellulosilytica TaxID=986710 RepID=A0ABW2F4R1_9BACL